MSFGQGGITHVSDTARAVGTAPVLMITEGRLMYLPGAAVEVLAEVAGRRSYARIWVLRCSGFSG